MGNNFFRENYQIFTNYYTAMANNLKPDVGKYIQSAQISATSDLKLSNARAIVLLMLDRLNNPNGDFIPQELGNILKTFVRKYYN